MKIEKGSEILCIRFVNIGENDCIQEHLNIIKSLGYVWFGKIGTKPMIKKLDKIRDNQSNYILLKDPKNAYICEFDAFSDSQPNDNEFPKYYKSEILPTRVFSIWFKLTSIKKISDVDSLNQIVLKSSRSPILETTRSSMASFFYTVARREIDL
jgi:hypothetical protein